MFKSDNEDCVPSVPTVLMGIVTRGSLRISSTGRKTEYPSELLHCVRIFEVRWLSVVFGVILLIHTGHVRSRFLV